jgi:hypothetical protein
MVIGNIDFFVKYFYFLLILKAFISEILPPFQNIRCFSLFLTLYI